MDTGTDAAPFATPDAAGRSAGAGSIPGAAFLPHAGGGTAPAPAAATAKPAAPARRHHGPGRGGSDDRPDVRADAAATKPASTGARIMIRDHDWIQGNPGQQGDWYDAFIAKFEDSHPDIKIEREWFPRAEMHAKQLALAATGQIGDTVRINLAPLISELQLKGVVRELNSLYQSDQQWSNNDLKQFWTGNLADLHPRGQAVGAARGRSPRRGPVLRQHDHGPEARPQNAAADGNWTFDDMAALAKGLTKSEGGRTMVYGIIPPVNDATANEGMVGFLRAFGGDLFDADGKKCLLNTPESKAGLKALADLYKSGAAIPWQPDIDDQTPGAVPESEGRHASFRPASPPRPGQGQIAKRPDPFEMDVFPNPLGPTGKHATQVSSDGKGGQHGQQEPGQSLDRAVPAVHRPAARHRALHQWPGQPGQPLRRVGQRRVQEGRAQAGTTSPR